MKANKLIVLAGISAGAYFCYKKFVQPIMPEIKETVDNYLKQSCNNEYENCKCDCSCDCGDKAEDEINNADSVFEDEATSLTDDELMEKIKNILETPVPVTSASNTVKPTVKASDIQWPDAPSIDKNGKEYYKVKIPNKNNKKGYTTKKADTLEHLKERVSESFDIV